MKSYPRARIRANATPRATEPIAHTEICGIDAHDSCPRCRATLWTADSLRIAPPDLTDDEAHLVRRLEASNDFRRAMLKAIAPELVDLVHRVVGDGA